MRAAVGAERSGSEFCLSVPPLEASAPVASAARPGQSWGKGIASCLTRLTERSARITSGSLSISSGLCDWSWALSQSSCKRKTRSREHVFPWPAASSGGGAPSRSRGCDKLNGRVSRHRKAATRRVTNWDPASGMTREPLSTSLARVICELLTKKELVCGTSPLAKVTPTRCCLP